MLGPVIEKSGPLGCIFNGMYVISISLMLDLTVLGSKGAGWRQVRRKKQAAECSGPVLLPGVKVGSKIVRKLCGVMTTEKASAGIVITSGTFTHGARLFAISKPIELASAGFCSLLTVFCTETAV
jgi:Restriction endonuclease